MNNINKINKTNKKGVNKKGFAYLILSIFLVMILFTLIFTKEDYKYTDKQESYKRKIIIMNDFVKGFNQDLVRATQIASFRTMIALEDHVASKGVFLNNTQNSFKETVFYGTIDGNESTLMNDSSILDYILKVESIASKIGINASVNITNITLNQSDPWNIDVYTDMIVKIEDTHSLAYWEYNQTVKSQVPIFNLRDPLYSVFSYNRIPNTIRASNYTPFVKDNTTTNLTNHIKNGMYIASNKAPSFLMRFENNNSASPYGIESIVDITAFAEQDLEDKIYTNRIKIDFMYFNNTIDNKVCNVQNMPEELEFIITMNRLSMYNITNLTYSTTCS